MALKIKGLKRGEVATALGEPFNDVGSLCKSTKINRWSRFKPYRYPQVTGIYGVSGTDDSIPKNTLNWGINPALVTAGLLPASQALADNWGKWGQWTPPSGGTATPYRLGDFRGYNHDAKPAIGAVIFYNNNGGTRPVVSGGRAKTFEFRAKLILNADADIKLSEYKATVAGSIMDMHLTLVIGTQMPSLSYPEARLVQSTKTIGQAIADGDTEIIAEMDTSNLDTENVLITPKNIVFAYLAPKTTSTTVFPEGLSLKIQDGIRDAYFNDTYATYGDGSSDGGTIPVLQIRGSLFFNDIYDQWPFGEVSTIRSGNSIFFTAQNLIVDLHTTVAGVQGSFELHIPRINKVYAFPYSSFSAIEGVTHIPEITVTIPYADFDGVPSNEYVVVKIKSVYTSGSANIQNRVSETNWYIQLDEL